MNPPQDIEAERALLGTMLLRNEVITDVAAILAPADFYRPQHEAIYAAIVDMYGHGRPVDWVTLGDTLSARRDAAQLLGDRGAVALMELTEAVPIGAYATHYAEIVRAKSLARRLGAAGVKIVQLAESGGDMSAIAEQCRSEVDQAASHAATQTESFIVGESLDATIDWLEAQPKGASTPWYDVNARTNGLFAGQMVTVAARPGHGKSLLLKDVGLHVAQRGQAVHIATLEMSRKEYIARILAGLAGVDLGVMLRRQMTSSDWEQVAAAQSKVTDLPLHIDDRERQSMTQIRAGARRTMRRHGELGLIGIDYAQLVAPADTRQPREQQVAQISRDTKLMSREFDCPVLLLAQLNRGNVSRQDPTPMVSDLRESGALEQDSDQVWLLHRPDQYGDGTTRQGEVDVVVGKNRNGAAPLAIPLLFRGHKARLENLVNPHVRSLA